MVPRFSGADYWAWAPSQDIVTNDHYLVATDGLNLKRSSFVCALLAQLPQVDVISARPIELTARPAATTRGVKP